jgi:hypothetical protein
MKKSDTLKSCELLLDALARGHEDAARKYALEVYSDLMAIEARGPCDHAQKHEADWRRGQVLCRLAASVNSDRPAIAEELERIGEELKLESRTGGERSFPRDPQKGGAS